MSPIPKPPKAKTPVEKAVDAILKQVTQGTMPMPTGVIVHPSMTQPVKEGPLAKAYREGLQGQRMSGVWWDEQHRMNKSQLERDLEDSLWALADATVPGTPDEVAKHSPHQQGSENRIKRVGVDHVHILCPCKTVLRFHRCVHGSADLATQCQEEVPVVEAGHALCVFHRSDSSAWLPGSRFFRCDYFNGDPPDGRCSRVAVRVDAEGRHWCSIEGHAA